MGNTTKFINALMVAMATIVGAYIYFNRDPGLPDVYRADHYWGSKTTLKGEMIN